MGRIKSLKVNSNSELISYIINQDPVLSAEIDLPVQGESTAKYGKLIMDNERYKNAFINTINLIGLTVIKRNEWENPWDVFTNRGTLRYGQSVRELILDLAKVYDYNAEYSDKDGFLSTEVPDVYNYIHNVNFQKFYKTTINDAELRMAVDSEDGILDLIERTTAMLYESYKYDKYQVDKYMLARRIVDGTVTSVKVTDYATNSARENVAFMKGYSNKMSFRSPNYNPAGIRKATRFEDQIMILDTDAEATLTTEVLATSFFRNDAEFKSNLAIVDGFDNFDDARLTELLGSGYTAFTETELTALGKVVGCLISREWFMDYFYALDGSPEGKKQTEFMNPQTLDRNIFLHAWLVMSTSPFENAIVFTQDTPAITSVTCVPDEVSVSAGLDVQLAATVVATGFANKSVTWAVTAAPGQQTGSPVTIDGNGKVHIPSDYTPTTTTVGSENPIVITCTSVYDTTKTDTCEITVL